MSGTADHDPVADDIRARRPASGDIVAGEQVLDAGRVAPEPDALRARTDAKEERPGSDAELARPEDPAHDLSPREHEEALHAADDRRDAGAPPPQPEPPG